MVSRPFFGIGDYLDSPVCSTVLPLGVLGVSPGVVSLCVSVPCCSGLGASAVGGFSLLVWLGLVLCRFCGRCVGCLCWFLGAGFALLLFSF